MLFVLKFCFVCLLCEVITCSVVAVVVAFVVAVVVAFVVAFVVAAAAAVAAAAVVVVVVAFGLTMFPVGSQELDTIIGGDDER